MRVSICAVGVLRSGPEKTLIDDYVHRFDRAGASLGLGPISIGEVDAKGKGMAQEGLLLKKAVPKQAWVCALDERGAAMTSVKFAYKLAQVRDMGHRDCAFVIGGADGLDPAITAQADARLSLGAMVWPHALARVMLVEQLYRAVTILAGHPYHRS